MADTVNLTEEYPWLHIDPSPILGDSRPRTVKEIVRKDDRIWLDLYRDWLTAHNSAYLPGLVFLTDSTAQVGDYSARLARAYPAFYAAAGELKAAVRKNAGAARSRFPWAPDNAAQLLGDARPKKYDDLVDEGPSSPWRAAFRGWLAANPPFASAAEWFDWLLSHAGTAQSWTSTLDPTVAAFAAEIGRLKDRLHDLGDPSVAQRILSRVGDTASRVVGGAVNTVGTLAGQIVDDTVERAATLTGVLRGGDDPARGGSGQATTTTTSPRTNPPTTAATATKPTGGASVAATQVRRQRGFAERVAAQATELSRWVAWLAPRFAAVGGPLAGVADSLQGYQQLVDQDGAALGQQIEVMRTVTGVPDGHLYSGLARMRDAVYRLAWNVDLGFQNYYGGWPHEHLAAVAQAVEAAQSPQLTPVAGQVLRRLAIDVDRVYDVASRMLDPALQMFTDDLPGYTFDDAAQPWSTHEVVGARAAAAAVAARASGWGAEPASEPADDEQRQAADEATTSIFGVGYDHFVQLAEDFR